MRNLIRSLVTIVCTLVCVVPSRAQEATVYAVIIGVENYADGEKLDGTVDNARMIAASVLQAFPGAKVRLMVSDAENPNDRPTLENVRTVLAFEMMQVPKYSFVIVYFAGHGIVVGNADARTDVGLVFEGGRPLNANPDPKCTWKYGEMLSAFMDLPMCNFMLFLDCCYAGPAAMPTAQIKGVELQALSLRGLVFAASTRSQKTIQDVFTSALGQYWEVPSNVCKRPTEMLRDIVENVKRALRARLGVDIPASTLSPQLVLGEGTQVCIGSFGRPSTLLYVIPPTTNDRSAFQFDGAEEEWFDPRRDTGIEAAFYPRQIARADVAITCTQGVGFQRTVRLDARSHLTSDIVWVDFRQPEGQEIGTFKSLSADTLRHASDLAYSVGARESSAYEIEQQYLFALAQEGRLDHGELQARLESRDYSDPRWAVLAGRNADATVFLSAAAGTGETFAGIAALNLVGRHKEAVSVAQAAMVKESWSSEVTSLASVYEYASMRLAGQDRQARSVAVRLRQPGSLEGAQLDCFEALASMSREEIGRSMVSMPISVDQWRLTARAWKEVGQPDIRREHSPVFDWDVPRPTNDDDR